MSHLVGRAARARIWLVVFLIGALLRATAAAAQPLPPALTAPVNDFAGAIDAASERELEALIRRLQAASGDVIVVATVNTFKPWADLPSYTVKMFENGGQGIGLKGKDNGLLIVLAVDDRGVRVEPGYDLEAFITDGFAGEVSREVMVPYFRSGDYGQGLLAGATRIAQRIAEGRNVDIGVTPVEPRRTRRNTGIRIPFGFWIVVLIIILNLIGGGGGHRGMRRRNRWISAAGAFGAGWPRGGGGWGSSGGFGGGFGGFGGGRSGGGGGGASW